MTTATVYDINERRKVTKFVQTKTDMNPRQWGKRQDMERGGWQFKKVSKMGEVVMTLGEPIEKMAFIEQCGHVQQYQYGDEV